MFFGSNEAWFGICAALAGEVELGLSTTAPYQGQIDRSDALQLSPQFLETTEKGSSCGSGKGSSIEGGAGTKSNMRQV